MLVGYFIEGNHVFKVVIECHGDMEFIEDNMVTNPYIYWVHYS